ncbi:MAG: sigma-54 dependent transcriptional regulator [Terracidiphilus sp.]
MSVDIAQSFQIESTELPCEAVIFGRTAAMREVRGKIDRILDNDLPVLIRGESGTGKELVARFLHLQSDRREKPFVKMNCAAMPGAALEIELLGFEKGAFAGAIEAKRGLVEAADGGTLFLDEIGDIHLSLQDKLLHLLQEGLYARIGGNEERQAHVRVVCATSRDLEAAVESRAFRQDLFCRIDVMCLKLQPLRNRKEDIPQLCDFFMHKLAGKFGRKAARLTPTAMHLLKQWNWPGNLRELENWIARVLILGADEALGAELRRQVMLASSADHRQNLAGDFTESSRETVSAATRAVILQVLRANHWNRRKTAQDLNMSYRSLLYKLRDVGMPQRRRRHIGLHSHGDSPRH